MAFAAAEMTIGLIALLSPHLLGTISKAYVLVYRAGIDHPAAFVCGRMALAAVILLPPTILMGGTLPLLIRGLVQADDKKIGGLTGLLYAVNTLGAVAGTAFAGFLSIMISPSIYWRVKWLRFRPSQQSQSFSLESFLFTHDCLHQSLCESHNNSTITYRRPTL